MPVLEKIADFQKFDQPSRRFMQFEERLLTDNKADQSHWSTVSFNNMMLRVPSSLNSKLVQFDEKGKIIDIPYDARVRIEKPWDGNTPIIGRPLLMQYCKYLQFIAIMDIRRCKVREKEQRKYGRVRVLQKINLHYDYIEKLINRPLDDFRKYCIWKIFVLYFINVKRLSRLETFNIVKPWLDRCDSVCRLNFNPKQKIDYALDHVGSYWPPHLDKLKNEHTKLYERLEKEGII